MFMDYYTLSEAASVFFDIASAPMVSSPYSTPFRGENIHRLTRSRLTSITDYALAVRVAALLWPLIQLRGRHQGSLLRQLLVFARVLEGDQGKTEVVPEARSQDLHLGLSSSMLLQRLRYHGEPQMVPRFPRMPAQDNMRPARRRSTFPHAHGHRCHLRKQNAEGRDDQRRRLKKWRWQINTQTVLSFTKSGGKVYADLEFATPNGDVENKVTTRGPATKTPSRAQHPRARARHASRSSVTSPTPPRVQVADGRLGLGGVQLGDVQVRGEARRRRASGESTCFGTTPPGWTDNGMFTTPPPPAAHRRQRPPPAGNPPRHRQQRRPEQQQLRRGPPAA